MFVWNLWTDRWDGKVLDRCLINIHLKVFAIWDGASCKYFQLSFGCYGLDVLCGILVEKFKI